MFAVETKCPNKGLDFGMMCDANVQSAKAVGDGYR